MNQVEASRRNRAAILLVDDNKHGLSARRSVLEELQYEVTTATSGEEALALFSARHFDLVVTDHRMPRMTGVELIAKIKAARPSTPVVLLSGFVDPLGLDERNTGADVVIAKSANEVRCLIRATAKLLDRYIPRKRPNAQKELSRSKTAGII
jgi:CheY-like chemotaxis protein